MIKLSEFTLIHQRRAAHPADEALGGDDGGGHRGGCGIAAAFSALPSTICIFTGSTAVGRLVMAAAAPSSPPHPGARRQEPCLIAPTCPWPGGGADDLRQEPQRRPDLRGPDYVLLPRGQEQAFIEAYQAHFRRLYPKGLESPDYGAIISAPSTSGSPPGWRRRGRPAPRSTPASRPPGMTPPKLVPHLLTEVPGHCQVMQQEIFRPLLPLVPYDDIEEALAYVAARPRPWRSIS